MTAKEVIDSALERAGKFTFAHARSIAWTLLLLMFLAQSAYLINSTVYEVSMIGGYPRQSNTVLTHLWFLRAVLILIQFSFLLYLIPVCWKRITAAIDDSDHHG